MLPVIFQVHKNDFILHIKNSRMLKDFEVADPASEFHWKKKADLAFRSEIDFSPETSNNQLSIL